jgi:hypothetical protein
MVVGAMACAPLPPPGAVYIERRPPPNRVEVVTVAPGREYVWVRGHWRWAGGDYDWVPGRWARIEHGRRWQEGRWRHHKQGWYWIEGHWR